MKKQSQISMEFLIAIGIIFTVFVTVTLLFSFERKKEVNDMSLYLDSVSECAKLTNTVEGVYAAGDGAQAEVKTDYLITFYNYSMISIESIEKTEEVENRIAFVVSDCGPSFGKEIGGRWYFDNESFNEVKAKLAPNFYYKCSSWCSYLEETGGSWGSCPKDFYNHGINQSIDVLFSNLSKYDTIYLEDAHMETSIESRKQALQNWVSGGKILVLSEHFIGLISPSYIGDFNFAGMIIHQTGQGDYNHPATVVEENAFYNLALGEQLDIEERCFVEEPGQSGAEVKAYSGRFTGTYSHSGGSYTDTFSNDNHYWYFGSKTSKYDITGYAELEYNISDSEISKEQISSIEFAARYCHSGFDSIYGSPSCNGDSAEGDIQGTQDVEVYNFTSQQWKKIGELRTNDNGNEVLNSYYAIKGITDLINSSNKLRLRYEMDYYNGNSEDSWLVIESSLLKINSTEGVQKSLNSIVKYNNNNDTAIGHWRYGGGYIFYFSDFQVNMLGKEFANEVLAELIEKGYFMIYPKKVEAFCPFYARSPYYRVSGNLLIKNENNMIHVENVTSS